MYMEILRNMKTPEHVDEYKKELIQKQEVRGLTKVERIQLNQILKMESVTMDTKVILSEEEYNNSKGVIDNGKKR